LSAYTPSFRRLVLSLSPPAASATMRLAAEFARLFDADLVALLVSDGGLTHFAAMPFARELSRLGGGWRKLEPAQLGEHLSLAAAAAERRLAGRGFHILRESAAALADIARADDLLVLPAPGPSDWAVEPQRSLLHAAFASHAAVLIAPAAAAPARGAITTLAAGANDPAIAAARAIAEAAGAPLEVLACDARDVPAAGRRLLVVTRGALPDEAACRVALRLRAPLLSLNSPSRDLA
jgi:hypothetical protein